MSGRMRRNLDTKEAREFWASVDAAVSDPLELTRRSQRKISENTSEDPNKTKTSQPSTDTDGMNLD